MGDSASDPMNLDLDVAAAAPRPVWSLPKPLKHPKSSEPAIIGYKFKHEYVTRVINQKSANKRGKTSWIWRHGFECRRQGPGQHPQKAECQAAWMRAGL